MTMTEARRLVGLVMLAATLTLVSGCALIGIVAESSQEPRAERAVVLRHILFSPNDDRYGAVELPLADPAWAVAEASAHDAADMLRAIAEPVERAAAFAGLARSESDDASTRATGGDTGTVLTESLRYDLGVDIFDRSPLAPGDIVGPVRTTEGWWLFLYQGEGDPGDAR